MPLVEARINISDSEDYGGSEDFERTSAAHSFVKIKPKVEEDDTPGIPEENTEEPDILSVNTADWYWG